MKGLWIGLGMAVLVTRSSLALVLAGPIVNSANSHQYYLLDKASWAAAEAEAITLGGHLVTINDQDEQDWVWSTFGISSGFGSDNLWIGMNDVVAEGSFVWTSGEPVTYTAWWPGEPNNYSAGEDWGAMWSSLGGKWNDVGPATTPETGYRAVVEVIPEPSAGLLVGLSLLGAAALRRRK